MMYPCIKLYHRATYYYQVKAKKTFNIPQRAEPTIGSSESELFDEEKLPDKSQEA